MAGRPRIEYPCPWSFALVGEDETAMRAAVEAVVGPLEHALERSNTSRSGRYTSLRLTLVVRDEAQRLSLGERLGAAPSIRMVL